MVEQENGNLSLEARTTAFFEQEVDVLAQGIIGKVISSQDGTKLALVTKTEAWIKEENSEKRYKPIHQMPPGELFVVRFPLRRMSQTLIVAKSGGETGACVRIKRVEYFDRKSGEFVEELEQDELGQKEGDIAKYFDLVDEGPYRLKFMDNGETMFISLSSSE